MKGMIGLIVGCLAVNAFYIVPAIGQANRAAEPKSAVGGVFLLGAKRAADQQSPACPGDICPGLGNAFYLPSQNSMSINSGGAVFFADRKLGTCAVVSSASVGARDFKTADSMEHFIDNTMAEANISGSYTSAALSVKATAQAMTGSSTDIKTTFHSAYMDISLITSTVDFLQDSQCFTAKNLDGDFQKRFEALAPIDPKKAGDAAQWTPYVNFLQSVGSHIMMQQQVGSRFQQWESSDSTASDIATTLQVKACAEVEGTAGTGGWSVNSCGSYSNDQKNAALKTTTSTKRVILGSTDAARRDLLNEVSAANLTKFIDGANTGSGAVRFLFKPIWDLLYGIYQADCTAKGSPACANMQRALNLQAAYDGWTAIGCPQLGDYQFMATDSTDEYGISTWRCVAAKTGCRSDDVCHLGGAGSVCYCYGSGCIDQGDAIPSRSGSGTQTFRDKIRGSQQGSYSEGVNNACYYHFGAYCDCDTNWAGGLPDRNVYQQSVPSALQALRARR
jgi:hypothetical protein